MHHKTRLFPVAYPVLTYFFYTSGDTKNIYKQLITAVNATNSDTQYFQLKTLLQQLQKMLQQSF